MRKIPVVVAATGVLLLWFHAAAFGQDLPAKVASRTVSSSGRDSPLTAEQVARELQERNAQRTAALVQFSGTRIYHMQYRGFPSDHDAEMVVHVTFRSPDIKEFTVVSQTGSKFILDHIFRRLLDGEKEAANQENRKESALTAENYTFTSAGYEVTSNGPQYVLNLLPKNKNKFLYRGKIWVDAKDFAVVRIEGEPAKNPSFWIKNTEVKHQYAKIDGLWLPAENRSESAIRLGGEAILTIEYKDYKVTKTALPERAETEAVMPNPK